MPGLNAAFVDVGYDKDAFLHYLDLGSHFMAYSGFTEGSRRPKENPSPANFKPKEEIPKQGSISQVLSQDSTFRVQIAKEPISSKGPRLTTEISFTGRFIGADSICRKDFHIEQNQVHRGEDTPSPAYREHKAERFLA